MKQILLLSIAVFFGANLLAQHVNWAYNTPFGGYNVRLTTDNASNLYQYNFLDQWPYAGPSEGTRIIKYDPNGSKLLEINWKERIYLTSMLNDGKGSFYFTGYFYDTIQTNGFNLISNGKSDCFFGKMDEQGQVKWSVGFGGAKDDRANSLAFNRDSTGIVLTGGVDSTVYLYDYPIITTTKAIFLISFNLAGKLVQYKTYSFLSNQYGTNMGLEIGANSGGYYLLADRMGEHWSNEPFPPGTEMNGRYLFKLDNSFNITWSQFIISDGCYYGYDCRNMSICYDDAYVPSFCSGKYGGTGHFDRLNTLDGKASWFLTNNDGEYYDSYTFEGRVFFVGNEEVNGCPCQDNDAGNGKVKVVNKDNREEILFAQHALQFRSITHAKNGSIYVFGNTWGEGTTIGGFPIDNGNFLFSLKDPTTGIRQIEAPTEVLTLYPNPSQGDLTIKSQDVINEITVFNLSGAAIYKTAPESKSHSIYGIPDGCYALQVKCGDKYTTSKIVVAN